jgi:hypothetical protein
MRWASLDCADGLTPMARLDAMGRMNWAAAASLGQNEFQDKNKWKGERLWATDFGLNLRQGILNSNQKI